VPKPERLDELHIIGADPGKITGLGRLHHGVLTTCAVLSCDVETVITGWLEEDSRALIGCERYVITQRTARLSAQPDAIRVTGVIHAVAERYPGVSVVDQNMSDAKRLMQPPLRRALGWHQSGPLARHCNDAVCQIGKVILSRHSKIFHDLVSPHIP